MRILPSWSSGTKRKVGSSSSLTISRSSPSRSRIAFQYSRLAPPSGSTPSFRPAPRIASRSITAAEVVDVGADVVALGDRRVGARHVVHLAGVEERLARRSIQPVTSVSAGPPCGGLYLKPPSPGGLCEGVTTIPSATPSWVRIAWEMTGVGVAPPSRSTTTSTPRAERTATIVSKAGMERACVSRPRKSGPSIPCLRAVLAHRGADGDDVRLGEGAVERGAAVAGGAERDGFARRAARRPRAARRRPRGRRARAAGRHAGGAHAADTTSSGTVRGGEPGATGSWSRGRHWSISFRRRTARSPRTPVAAPSQPHVRSGASGGPWPSPGG